MPITIHPEYTLKETKKDTEYPDDHPDLRSLGIAYAGLGRKENAINVGKRGVNLLPVSKDAYQRVLPG